VYSSRSARTFLLAADRGVLTLTIPVAEQAKPRKVEITHAGAVVETITAPAVDA
jgi:HSP20 family protein